LARNSNCCIWNIIKPRVAGVASARRRLTFYFAEVVGQDDQPQIVLVGFIGLRCILAPQLDGGQRIVGLFGGQRHFGGALGQARILGLFGQAQHGQVRTLPVTVLVRHFRLHQLRHHGRRHGDVGEFFLRLGSLAGHLRMRARLGGGQRLVRRVRRRRLPGRYGTGREQCGERYNGESVFQGKSHIIKMVRFYARRHSRVRGCNTNLQPFPVRYFQCLNYQR
jgi:hypothetical protein